MKIEDIKDYLSTSARDKATNPEVNKTLTSEVIQLTLGDVFGEVYYSQPVGHKEQFVVSSMTYNLSRRIDLSERRIQGELKRYLGLRTIGQMNLGQYEKAVEYLASRAL